MGRALPVALVALQTKTAFTMGKTFPVALVALQTKTAVTEMLPVALVALIISRATGRATGKTAKNLGVFAHPVALVALKRKTQARYRKVMILTRMR
jgi:hypothetical protein